MHAMHQHDRAGTRPPRHEPAAQRRARARRDRDGLDGKICGRRADGRARGCGEEQADRNDPSDQKGGAKQGRAKGELDNATNARWPW
jgi:hypothetical protein